MKKISVILFSIILALSASAQKVIVRPVPVGPPVIYYSHPYFNPYYYGGGLRFGLNYPMYGRQSYYNHPTKMERQIQDIENDYSDRISSVRADDSLTGHERRVKVRELKRERDQAVDDYRKNYYKQYEN
ncbi:MAG: hypothetical protein ABJB05_08855 [Parafilimonas sp.]